MRMKLTPARSLFLGVAIALFGGLGLTQLNLLTDSRGNITFARPVSDQINARALAASSAETTTVPSGARFVIFSSTADFYAKPNATATIPGDVTDGTACELNPAMWVLTGISNISVIAPADTVITFTYYTR